MSRAGPGRSLVSRTALRRAAARSVVSTPVMHGVGNGSTATVTMLLPFAGWLCDDWAPPPVLRRLLLCAREVFVVDNVARFWAKVDTSNDCWLWTGATQHKGYGVGYYPGIGTGILAHRFSWQIAFGPIPAGLCVLHRCDVRRCVRPDHLFLGTIADNNADMVAKGRAVYAKGERIGAHKLTEDAVREIRELLTRGMPTAVIARRYGVGKLAIRNVGNRTRWRHVL